MVNKNKFAKRIAIFVSTPISEGGGAEKFFIETAKYLSNKNVPIDIVTLNQSFYKVYARFIHIIYYANFVKKLDYKGNEDKKEIKKRISPSRWIETSLFNLKKTLNLYDVIYTKNEVIDLLILKIVGIGKMKKIILGMHTPHWYSKTKSFISRIHNTIYGGIFYKWLISDIKTVHSPNTTFAKTFKKQFDKNIYQIYYPISLSHIKNSSKNIKCSIKFDPKRLQIIYLGRIGEQKGIDYLCNLLNILSQQKEFFNKIQFNIIGSGEKKYEDIFNNLSKRYPWIHYYGYISSKFIPHILSKQDLLLSFSRWETLPYNILEAQALGVPVIAFDIPGPQDIIQNGKTGFLVRSEAELIEKITHIINHNVSFDKQTIINHIKVKFNDKRIYKEMLMMLYSAL